MAHKINICYFENTSKFWERQQLIEQILFQKIQLSMVGHPSWPKLNHKGDPKTRTFLRIEKKVWFTKKNSSVYWNYGENRARSFHWRPVLLKEKKRTANQINYPNLFSVYKSRNRLWSFIAYIQNNFSQTPEFWKAKTVKRTKYTWGKIHFVVGKNIIMERLKMYKNAV